MVVGIGRHGPLGLDAPLVRNPSEADAWAVLASVEVLGPVAVGCLLRHFGSARDVLDAAMRVDGPAVLAETPAEHRDGRRPVSLAVAEHVAQAAGRAGELLEAVRRANLRVVTLDDPAYPAWLLAIEMPPHALFVQGDVTALSASAAVAIVGTRDPTDAGRLTAIRIAGSVTRAGGLVVSGLAMGIDGVAHHAAVEVGGPTVAVIGSGHAQLYPSAHRELSTRIVATGGAVMSELPPHVHPSRATFPRRNRLIAGLTDATIVVEAPAKSGALITANWALEQGRECFVVPGAIDDPAYAGSLALLRQYGGQARSVATVAQLLDDLGLVIEDEETRGPRRRRRRHASSLPGPSPAALLAELGPTEARVARLLLGGRSTVDELAFALGLPVATILGTLTLLEMRGLATSAYGRYRPAGALVAAA